MTVRCGSWYARPWLLCLASTYEGFGQPCVEVTGGGTPPVAARNPGIRLVSGRRRSAALVEDDRLRVTLAQLVSDEARREQLAALEATLRASAEKATTQHSDREDGSPVTRFEQAIKRLTEAVS